MEAAQAIAFDMGIEYPKDKETKFPFVLTTDFMITIRNGDRIIDIARTIKPSKELENQSHRKFEIERRYWAAKGLDWGIVTEKEIPTVLAKMLNTCIPRFISNRPTTRLCLNCF